MSVIAAGGTLVATPGTAYAAPSATVHRGHMTSSSPSSRLVGPVLAWTKAVPRATLTSLSVDRASLPYGQSIVLTGRFAAADQSPLAAYPVRLEQSTGGAWTTVGGALARGDGSVTFTVKPAASARYRLAFVGLPDLGASVSAEQSVTVQAPPRPVITTRASSGTSGTAASGGVIGSNGVQASAAALAFLEAARAHTGKRYVYGAAGPDTFDCSGLVMYVAAQFGVNLPHQANAQMAYGTRVSAADAAPGDLIFFLDGGGYAYHVGIYAGGNQVFAASNPRTLIGQQNIWGSNVVFRRIL